MTPPKNKSSQMISSKDIIEARKKIDLSVDQFAQLLNVSTRTVQRWEKEGAELGQSAGVTQLLYLYHTTQDEATLMQFMDVKRSVLGTHGLFPVYNSIGLSTLSGIVPLFGMLASGPLGTLVVPIIIKSLQKLLDTKKK